MGQQSKAMSVYEKALELDANCSEAMEGVFTLECVHVWRAGHLILEHPELCILYSSGRLKNYTSGKCFRKKHFLEESNQKLLIC